MLDVFQAWMIPIRQDKFVFGRLDGPHVTQACTVQERQSGNMLTDGCYHLSSFNAGGICMSIILGWLLY